MPRTETANDTIMTFPVSVLGPCAVQFCVCVVVKGGIAMFECFDFDRIAKHILNRGFDAFPNSNLNRSHLVCPTTTFFGTRGSQNAHTI